MIFKCENSECENYDAERVVKILSVRVVDGQVVKDVQCSSCKIPMTDVTEHEGFGQMTKPLKDRGKAYYEKRKR